MDDLSNRAHIIVLLGDENVIVLQEIRGGSVRYVMPGVATRPREMPGRAAGRAARECLGFDVAVTDLLFADTEMGIEHFFFVGTPIEPFDESGWTWPPAPSGHAVTILRRGALLGYPVRPVEVARALRRLREDARTRAGTAG